MTDFALYSLDDDNVVVFGIGNTDRLVEGPAEALQVAAHHLFTTQGSCAYDRDEGGSLQSLIGGNLKSREEIRAEAVIIVNRAKTKIRKTQSDDKALDATITDLRLLDAKIIRSEARIDITIRIDLLDGNSFQATFRVT
jgi:hypothetical protein